jgi:hypothetical protein
MLSANTQQLVHLSATIKVRELGFWSFGDCGLKMRRAFRVNLSKTSSARPGPQAQLEPDRFCPPTNLMDMAWSEISQPDKSYFWQDVARYTFLAIL